MLMSRDNDFFQDRLKVDRPTEFRPEQLLTSLFIQASLPCPSNISGQGIWLTLLLRQGQAAGRIDQSLSPYTLKAAFGESTKDEVLEVIIHAAHKAHRHLKDKPSLSPRNVEGIVSEVLSASIQCQAFDDNQLHTLLEMLPIYMQVIEHVSGNEMRDAQNPELLTRKARIKDIVSRTFKDDQQQHILRMVDEVLFTRMPSLHTYVDARFKIFLTLIALCPRATMPNKPEAGFYHPDQLLTGSFMEDF